MTHDRQKQLRFLQLSYCLYLNKCLLKLYLPVYKHNLFFFSSTFYFVYFNFMIYFVQVDLQPKICPKFEQRIIFLRVLCFSMLKLDQQN